MQHTTVIIAIIASKITDIYQGENIMCITYWHEDDTEKHFIVVKERATVSRTLNGNMLTIYCSKTMGTFHSSMYSVAMFFHSSVEVGGLRESGLSASQMA